MRRQNESARSQELLARACRDPMGRGFHGGAKVYTKRALRGLVWVDASANRVAAAYTCAPLCNRRLTQRRTLGGGVTEKRILRVGRSKGCILYASGRAECVFP